MAAWLTANFVWVGLALAIVLIGLKLAIGGILKRLMDESAAREAEATRSANDGDPS
jgi:hypothetical protein